MLTRLVRRLPFHPSAFLLALQLLLLGVYAASDRPNNERALINAFGVIVLVLIVWVVNRSPGPDWVAWVLAAPALALSVFTYYSPGRGALTWSWLLEAALYFYAAGSLIAYMMKDYRVTTDELFAAGATFTLLAWGFAYLFLLCQEWFPGSFVGGLKPGQPLNFVEMLFLSFTNLSSAGLSDLLPATALARVLLMFEQFVGVGYVAVVVSRLVGLTIQRQKASERE